MNIFDVNSTNFGKFYCKSPSNRYVLTRNQNLLKQTAYEVFNSDSSDLLQNLNNKANKDVVLVLYEDGSAILKTQDATRQRIQEEDEENPLVRLKQKTIQTIFPLKKFTCFDIKKVEDFFLKCNNYLKAIIRKSREQYID